MLSPLLQGLILLMPNFGFVGRLRKFAHGCQLLFCIQKVNLCPQRDRVISRFTVLIFRGGQVLACPVVRADQFGQELAHPSGDSLYLGVALAFCRPP